ncbi:hypothetical protein F3J16_37470, partial [Burkholderia sp. Ap-962]
MQPTRFIRPPRPFSLVSRSTAVPAPLAPSRIAARLAAVLLLSALLPPAAMAADAATALPDQA